MSPAVVRRALVRGVVATGARIPASGSLTPEEVHYTRKHIKRARATLSLLRPALSAPDYAAANRALREAGRSLAAARDAAVMPRTYDRMRARAGVTRIKKVSRGGSAEQSRQSEPTRVDVARASHHLSVAAARLKRGKILGRGWPKLRSGLRAVYRRGRRRVPHASSDTSSDALHDWRKHAKRYWHVLELFQVLNPPRLQPAIDDARRLAELLGEEHDLALLEQQIRARRSPGPGDAKVLHTISARREKLVRHALKLGSKVYADKAKTIEEQMRADWERWRIHGPASRRRTGARVAGRTSV
jgi:CHAD domain-containing protein